MNPQKWISLLALICFLAAVIFLVMARNRATGPALGQSDEEKKTVVPPPTPAAEKDPRVTRLADGRVQLNSAVALSETLHQEEPEQDLEILTGLLEQYAKIFQSNPVGSENIEIVAQLLGDNEKKLVFLNPDHPALDPSGALLDRWGSPYVFHPLSATMMEVLSLGPDQTLWTEDDLLLEMKEVQHELQL